MSYRMLPIKDLAKLTKKRFRDEEGVFLVEGKKIIQEVAASGLKIYQVLVTGKFQHEQREFLESLPISAREVTVIADHNAIRLTDTATPSGVFAVIQKPESHLENLFEKNFVVVCENIRDPGNLGTMIRTADWFGVDGVIVSENGVDPYNDKVVRSTMGSLFHLPIVSSADLVSDLTELKNHGFQIVVSRPEVDAEAPLLKGSAKMCLVLGNESLGTSAAVDELADHYFSIPKYGKAESLNVAVSFGIMLSELQRLR